MKIKIIEKIKRWLMSFLAFISRLISTKKKPFHGMLYQFDHQAKIDKVLPNGWSCLTDNDWNYIEKKVAGEWDSSWDSEIGWRGSHREKLEKVLNILPSGLVNTNGTTSNYFGNYAFFWSSSAYSSTYAWYRYLFYDNTGVYRSNNTKTLSFSVRCKKLYDGGLIPKIEVLFGVEYPIVKIGKYLVLGASLCDVPGVEGRFPDLKESNVYQA